MRFAFGAGLLRGRCAWRLLAATVLLLGMWCALGVVAECAFGGDD